LQKLAGFNYILAHRVYPQSLEDVIAVNFDTY